MTSSRKRLAALAIGATLTIAALPARAALAEDVPQGVTTGYVLFDRGTNSVVTQRNQDKQFRSASVVKLIIALDYLTTKGSLNKVPESDLATLQRMLRSSDDVAARTFWQAAGRTAVINRMVPKLGLKHTQPPADPNFWGYTALSASDVVRVYQYLLKGDPNGFGAFILDNLHQSTRCAIDGRDQYFGIPSAVPPPFGVKQGWSGFGETPPGEGCTSMAEKSAATGKEASPQDIRRMAAAKAAPGIDLTSPLLHTTGVVDNDSRILVVLTLFPAKTPWSTAADQITNLTQQVYNSGQPSEEPDAE